MSTPITGSMFLTVRRNDRGRLVPVKVTAKLPSAVDWDCAVIRVQVSVPGEAFVPLRANPLEVQVEDVPIRAEVSS